MSGLDASAAAPADQRLHPWSWLFVLLQQLRQFIVPLVVLLFAGRRGNSEGWWELAPLLGVGALVLVSVLQYFTYRYRVGRDGITIRSGLLQRSQREIPFARIHNVGLHQSLLHRLFGVAEVRLESAGGQKPEAHMRVLGIDDALALERLVRHHGAEAADAAAVDAGGNGQVDSDGRTLLALTTAEIVRLGLVSNRGMIVFAAGFGLLWQLFPDERLIARYAEDSFQQAAGYAGELHLGWPGIASAMLAEAGLSFLGLGVSPDIPTWGTMISSGRQYIGQADWMTYFPGFAIVLAVLSLQMVGDGLRDLLDPRLRKDL